MSLTLLLIFIIFAIAGRVVLQYKLTGDHGIRTTNRASSKTEKVSSSLIIIAFFGVATVSVLFVFIDFSLHLKFSVYGQFIGVILCTAGIVLTSASQIQMGKSWRIGVDSTEKTDLITHGIYSVIRNPIYSGVMVFGLGQLVLIPHLTMLLFISIGYVAIDLHVRKVEEPYLRELHGKAFTDYAITTGRYVPKT
ncbi:isoprenylcysteine carboxylmethyltransferase family protein [Gammaproteobacteria bacterium]|nr:isoprenylcysteine carboxylmethyltransferase family protein [Gammaproteobacteria bacterium]